MGQQAPATYGTRAATDAAAGNRWWVSAAAEPTTGGGYVDWVAGTLDGQSVLDQIKGELTLRVAALRDRGVIPGMATINVGAQDDAMDRITARHRDCLDIGIDSQRHNLPAESTQSEVEDAVREVNADESRHGLVVQFPLPPGLDRQRIIQRMDPRKDILGSHPVNLGHAVLEQEAPLPCAARGCLELLRRHDIRLAGAHVVVVGSGTTADQLVALLVARVEVGATVTLCNVANDVVAELVRTADVVIVSSGLTTPITADMVKPWATVLDMGWRDGATVTERRDRLDSIDEGVQEVARWVAPAGGVRESLTRAMLLTNLVEVAERGLAPSTPVTHGSRPLW